MATRLNDLLDKVFKVDPEYIVRKLEVDNPIFEQIKKVESTTPFYLVERYGLRGTVQGYDTDSITDTITNYLAEYNFIKPYDYLVGVAGVHKFTQAALEKVTTDNNALYDFASGLVEDISNTLMLNIKKLFYTPIREGNTPAIAVSTLSTTNYLPSGTSDFGLVLNIPSDTNAGIGAWLMDVGDVYEIYVDGVLRMVVRVASINDDRKTVIFNILYNTLAADLTAGDAYFHIQQFRGRNLVNYPLIASTNRTLHNVDSTTYKIWNGINYVPTSAALTKSVIRTLIHKIEVKFQRPDIKQFTDLYTTRWQLENLEADLASSSIFRVDVNNNDLKWGFKVKVDNVNVYADPFVPPTYAYVPRVEYLQFRYFQQPVWVKLGGEIIHPDNLQSPQNLRAVLRWDIQFATEYPDYQARISGLASDFSFT